LDLSAAAGTGQDDRMLQDCRFAARMLWKNRAYTLPSMIALAIAMTATVSIVTLAYAVLARPLAFADPGALYRVYGQSNNGQLSRLFSSVPRFEHFRDQQQSFVGLAAYSFSPLTLTGFGDAARVQALRASANYLDVVGVSPMLGRGILPEEDRGGAPVALLTQKSWRERFNRDPGAVGRAITLDGRAHTIVGVLPDLPAADIGPTDFVVNRPYEVGVAPELLARGVSFMRLTGRLKPGVTPQAAQAEFNVLADRYAQQNAGKADAEWKALLVPIREDLTATARPALLMLVSGVILLHVIACANVANLLLASFARRRREIAVRTALGARRAAVVRLFLCETVLLSGLSAVLGLAGATQVFPLFPPVDGSGVPAALDNTIWWGMVALTGVFAGLTAVAIGAYPAVELARGSVADMIKDGSRGQAGSIRQRGFRSTLVGVQVAMSLALVFAALLLISTIRHLLEQAPGFNPAGIATTVVTLPAGRYPDAAAQIAFWTRLREALASAPGVASAALVQGLPLAGFDSRAPYARLDDQTRPLNQRPLGLMRSVTPGYFRMMEIPLLSGREALDSDTAAAPPVAILSKSTAAKLFPDGDALGRFVMVGSAGGGIRSQVVGIVGDTRSVSLAQVNDIEIYRPLPQRVNATLQVAVKMAGPAVAGVSVLRDTLQGLDPQIPVVTTSTLEALIEGSVGNRRLLMVLLGIFAGLSLSFAAIGIFSVVSYVVGQRTQEIGVRIALGATPASIQRLTLTQALKPVFGGVAGGVFLAGMTGRAVQTQVFGVSAFDPRLFAAAAALLVALALLASALPARRASRIDPLAALRAE
jgi:putative ABC transport system permease protein